MDLALGDNELMNVRRMFVDSPNSLGGRARARRWEMFHHRFPGLEKMRVLDLGGTVEFWRHTPITPAHVTLINLDDPYESIDTRILALSGDACCATEVLAKYGIESHFDLVFSNSLIEHVGGHSKRLELSGQIRALAPNHWVQTPYRYFPIEPHWVFPAMQFLPAAARVQVALRWPLGGKDSDKESARRHILWTELLSTTEMREYFPDSTLLHERFLGLTKSLIAVH
jgi:hypothetical protein